MKKLKDKGLRAIFKDLCKTENPSKTTGMACEEKRKRALMLSEWVSVGNKLSFHYLLTSPQRNKEAVVEGFQVSKWFLQMIQDICVGHFWVTIFLNVVFRTSFPRLLNKMFDCLNSLPSHLFTCFHRQLQHKKGLNDSETSQPHVIRAGIFNKGLVRQREPKWNVSIQL